MPMTEPRFTGRSGDRESCEVEQRILRSEAERKIVASGASDSWGVDGAGSADGSADPKIHVRTTPDLPISCENSRDSRLLHDSGQRLT